MKLLINLIFGCSVLIYYPFFIEEFETGKVLAITAFACFAGFYVNYKHLLKDKITQVLSLFVLSAGLSTYLSIDWHMSLYGNIKCRAGLSLYASLLIFFLSLKDHLKRNRDIQKSIEVIVILSLGVALYACFQVIGIDLKTWKGALKNLNYTRPMSFLGHPNFMANYLAMTLPFTVYLFEKASLKRFKYLYGSITGLSIIAIYFSLSRGMYFATLGALTSYFILNKKRLSANLIPVAVMSFIVLLNVMILSPSFRATALERYENMFNLGGPRLEYMKNAFRVWKRYPITGSGTDTYEIAAQHHRSDYYWSIEAGGSPHRAHNDFLNILSTQGFIGGFIVILLSALIFLKAKASKSIYRVPAIASIIAFYIAGLSSFYISSTLLLFLFSLHLLHVGESKT